MRYMKFALAISTVMASSAGVAQASPVQDLALSVSPAKAGTTSSPNRVRLTMSTNARETASGVVAPPVKEVALYLPKGSVYNARGWRPGTVVGSGAATLVARGGITQEVKITVSSRDRKQVNLTVEGIGPLRVYAMIVADISPASGDFGLKLTVPVPKALQEPVAGLPMTISALRLTVGRTIVRRGKKRGILSINGCTGTWLGKATFSYVDGTTTEATASTPCVSG